MWEKPRLGLCRSSYLGVPGNSGCSRGGVTVRVPGPAKASYAAEASWSKHGLPELVCRWCGHHAGPLGSSVPDPVVAGCGGAGMEAVQRVGGLTDCPGSRLLMCDYARHAYMSETPGPRPRVHIVLKFGTVNLCRYRPQQCSARSPPQHRLSLGCGEVTGFPVRAPAFPPGMCGSLCIPDQ
ncbi:hypothetical protein GW7_12046 [Heterocephalus glaber]|uniref:Uncharacterized protein n=1 Tax=Heterocephalus glaber TaxID=10181 RepID=G5C066_HETGA|nr:hypothetical protein GW7_12046 [Heterocephalus glaber]